MRNTQRLKEWAAAYQIPAPDTPSPRLFPTSPIALRGPADLGGASFRNEATSELQRLRTSKIASSSRISLFTSDQLKERKQHKWTFSRTERYDALENVFGRKRPAGLGQALIEYVPGDFLDITVIEEEQGKKRQNGLRSQSNWLERAAAQGEVKWVELFASRGARQASLDRALRAAIEASTPGTIDLVRVLLTYGADPNLQSDAFLQAVQMGNRLLMEQFLTSCRTPLSGQVLGRGLELAVQMRSYPTASLLLSHGADCDQVFGKTMLAAIQLPDVRMVCMLLLGSQPESFERAHIQRALSAACDCPDDQIRVQLLDLLLCFGVPADDNLFRGQFQIGVEKNQLDLLSMLVSHRVLETVEDLESIRLAICHLRYDALRILLSKPLSKHGVSTAIDMILPSASEEQAIELLAMLAEKEYEPGTCGRLLLRAVKQHESSLLESLLVMSPSIGFQEAQAVKLALQRQDLPLFDQLLERGLCSPSILSKVVPGVFQLGRPDVRRQTLLKLIEKGIASPELDMALQRVVTPEHRDLTLVSALLAAGASVDYRDHSANCIQTAAQNGDLDCLTLLCQANPRPADATLSSAVPLAFATRATKPYDTVVSILKLLLPEGIKPSDELAQTLVSAIREDEQHHIIHLLLKSGANVNYENGLPFEIAYKLPSSRPWQLLCGTGRMSPAVYSQLLPMAIENSTDTLRASTLLKCGSQHPNVLSQLLVDEARAKCRPQIMLMLLKYGASVDYSQGQALVQAIGRNSMEGVQLLLEKAPNQASLAQAFSAAHGVSCSSEHRVKVLHCILKAPYTNAPLNEALVESISKGELKVVQLLLDHGASVDFDQGHPLNLAIQPERQPILDALLLKNPHPESIARAFHRARGLSMTELQRTRIYASLLRHNIPSHHASVALLEAVTRGSKSVDLLQLLLNHKASLEYDQGKALCILVSRGEVSTAEFLLQNSTVDMQTLDYAFNSTMGSTTLDKKQRLSFAKLLLPVSNVEMARHLPQAVQEGDYELLELLIKSGANPGMNKESVRSAALNGDYKSLKTLLDFVDEDAVNDAFKELLDAKTIESQQRGLQVAKLLLDKGVDRELQSRALVEGFGYGKREEFVHLILNYEPDVNVANGRCFMHATAMKDLTIFDKMLERGPSLDAIVPAMMASAQSEERLLELLGRCFASASLEEWSSKLVFLALDQYPASAELIKMLIKNGSSPGETMELKLSPHSEKEAVTPLIWALSKPRPGVRDAVILALVEAGDEAQPNFVTERTEVCAIFKAVQSGRHAILQKLIAAGAEVDVRDAQGRFPLFYAASAGDGKAIHQLIGAGARVDDGSLHEAARDLHHTIVEQLIGAGHDPNAPSEHHGSRTALAELCLHARPEGRQWESKARKVIDGLLRVTPVEQKYQDLDSSDRKNILHLAIDNPAGFDVVHCLLGFRQVRASLNSDEFLYEDSSSLCYSPTRYVEHFYVGPDQSEMKQKLIRLLKVHNCEDRFFKLKGLQPQGYTGLPKFMVDQDRQNLIQDRAHQENLRRIRERAEVEIELSNKMAANSLTQESKRQRQFLEHSSAQEAFENSKRTNLLEYNRAVADNQLSMETARLLNEHEHADNRRQAEFAHSSRLANLKTESMEQQARVQQRLLDRGDESVTRRAEEYRRVMNTAARSPQSAMPSMPNLLLEGPD